MRFPLTQAANMATYIAKNKIRPKPEWQQNLAAVEDPEVIRRNGLWGMRDIERWLSTDAGYVVLDPRLLETGLATRGQQIRLIRSLLGKHFERIGRVDDYQWFPYDVYRRRI